jgi:aminoglycoside 3'-phosphotransferase-2
MSRPLRPFDIIRFQSEDPAFSPIQGAEGYVNGIGDFDDPEVSVHFYDLDHTWVVPVAGCVATGRVDDETKAHFKWANRARMLANGRELNPPPHWRRHSEGCEVLFQTIGQSGAEVFRVGDALFIKSEPIGALGELPGEIERLRWLGDTGIPCPEVVDTAEHAGRTWLLMSALPGSDLASSPDLDPRDVARILGRALRTLHELDVSDCPFDHRIEPRLALARRRLDAGLYDGDDPSRGEGDYAMAFSTRPFAEDLVVTHGDACLPNLLAQDGSFTGFVDCGRLGVADRHQDLALACRSFARNCGSASLSVLLDAYGIAEPDPQKLAWYSLLDEFF